MFGLSWKGWLLAVVLALPFAISQWAVVGETNPLAPLVVWTALSAVVIRGVSGAWRRLRGAETVGGDG